MAIKVEWYADDPGYKGGAEYSADELKAQAPAEIFFTEDDAELIILQNCIQLSSKAKFDVPFIKVIHDVWPHGDEEFRQYVLDNAALLVFSSPLHIEHFPHKFKAPYIVIPPAMNLRPFYESEKPRERDVIWVANNLTGMKGRARAVRWAFETQTSVDYYGINTLGGPVEFKELPELMGHYRRFLYLPVEIEPFGRTVAEAWASDLELILDESKIGALWWIHNRPEDVSRGAEMFWEMILERFTPST